MLLVVMDEWPLSEESAVVGRDCIDPSERVGDCGASRDIACTSCCTGLAVLFADVSAVAEIPFTFVLEFVFVSAGVTIPGVSVRLERVEVGDGLYGLGERVRMLGNRVDREPGS